MLFPKDRSSFLFIAAMERSRFRRCPSGGDFGSIWGYGRTNSATVSRTEDELVILGPGWLTLIAIADTAMLVPELTGPALLSIHLRPVQSETASVVALSLVEAKAPREGGWRWAWPEPAL